MESQLSPWFKNKKNLYIRLADLSILFSNPSVLYLLISNLYFWLSSIDVSLFVGLLDSFVLNKLQKKFPCSFILLTMNVKYIHIICFF